MNNICKDIFTAIHEGKWLQVEYKNKDENITRYWVGVKDINLKWKSLIVEGFHLVDHCIRELSIYIDSIVASTVLHGTCFPINQSLVEDIHTNRKKYELLFSNIPNLKILNYLSDCAKMDNTPYCTDYLLLKNFDDSCIENGEYKLSDEQFAALVKDFQNNTKTNNTQAKMQQLCMNVISVVNRKNQLYRLAYRRLFLDVQRRLLKAEDAITLCKEFAIDGETLSIRYFLDEPDVALLDDFVCNIEEIKDRIASNSRGTNKVDDLPYIMSIGLDIQINLDREYAAIIKMYDDNEVTKPMNAFFGELVEHAKNRKTYPIALLNKQINLDQLLAINNAMKQPLTYIQGPPGTGKTKTIINTIVTAFFNNKTVLFSSYNNHPIDSVFHDLSSLQYKNRTIPFPIIRLGNNEKVRESIAYIKALREQVRLINVFDTTLDKNKDAKIERTKKLTALLKRYEEIVDLKERRDAAEELLDRTDNGLLTFKVQLQAEQISKIDKRIQEIGEVTDEEALSLLSDDFDEFLKYLNFTSAKYIKRLERSEYSELREILDLSDEQECVRAFNNYLADDANMRKFLHVFPIVVTTCISSYKLGEPKQYFDLVILDEASQCNPAVSLVSIIRGNSLMLVGDPQQLNPVVLLDKSKNSALRHKYGVTEEYDYISKSIYDTYIACDPISDEVLLSFHYRSNEKIIQFSNKKYYNSKLKIRSNSVEAQPLVFVDVKNNETDLKNTAPEECDQIVKFILQNRDKKIGVITPFVNQKKLINDELQNNGITDITCGTVHAFQGDEKDVILFSLALTDMTHQSTYDWLKNNKELINVAVSRAKDKFILLASTEELDRLHKSEGEDDIYELVQYVKSNGESKVTSKLVNSRAFGIKPYTTETETAFMTSLTHALSIIQSTNQRYEIKEQCPISDIFKLGDSDNNLFFTGSFDFVVLNKHNKKPILAIELDGKEHYDDEIVKARDAKKKELCEKHNFALIRVDNSYARRYAHIKQILIQYFKK